MTAHLANGTSHLEQPDSTFVGRKRELTALWAALQRAREGLGSVILLSGEAGVGKTLLATQFADFARTGGATVLQGRANVRLRDSFPFGVWKQILSDQSIQRNALGLLSTDLTSNGSVPLQLSKERQTHPELLESTTRALTEQAKTQPLVLVVDDLFAADPLSLQAFRILAHELSRYGTVVVGIYRDSQIRRFQEFEDLLIDPLIRDSKRISLSGFNDEETREFVECRTMGPVEEETLEALRALTAGNPGLLDVALRHRLFAKEGAPRSGKSLGGLLRVEIEGHIEHLSLHAREVLSTASLNGTEFRLSTLIHVLDQGPGELLDSLQEAEQSGLLKAGEVPGTYRFRQTLVQEILSAEMSGARRARLHKRFGEVLEALHPSDETFVEKKARHFYEAAMLGCADKAAEYCARAAGNANSVGRREDALRFYHMALVALECQGSNPDAIRDFKAKLEEVKSNGTHQGSRAPQFYGGVSASETEATVPKTPVKSSSSGRLRPSQEGEAPASSMPLETPLDSGGDNEVIKRAGEQIPAPRPDHSAAKLSSEIQKNTIRREGDFWTLIFDQRVLRLKHSNGLLFVAHLLQHPDRDFHVAQLVALLSQARPVQAEAIYLSRADKERLGMHDVAGKDSNPLLDPTAKAEYRRRIEELRDSLEQAKEFNDNEKAANLEKELEFIGVELSRAVGVGGRDRKHRAEDEHARVNVTNSFRILTAKIAKDHPALGRYLRLTIRTGRYCSYRPDPSSHQHWEF